MQARGAELPLWGPAHPQGYKTPDDAPSLRSRSRCSPGPVSSLYHRSPHGGLSDLSTRCTLSPQVNPPMINYNWWPSHIHKSYTAFYFFSVSMTQRLNETCRYMGHIYTEKLVVVYLKFQI